ncbi:putative reverse transcriptase domain-containing protein [Tanacetum coccineum]
MLATEDRLDLTFDIYLLSCFAKKVKKGSRVGRSVKEKQVSSADNPSEGSNHVYQAVGTNSATSTPIVVTAGLRSCPTLSEVHGHSRASANEGDTNVAGHDTSTLKVVNEVGKNDVVGWLDGLDAMLENGSMDGLDAMLENGAWFIRNNLLILKKWHPDVNLLKEDVGTVLVLAKLYGVPVTVFNEDGLSSIATKLGQAMIELRADVELKDNIVVAMPKITREGYYTCNIHVEYEWKPPRCACCKVFGHVQEECLKNIGVSETKNMKKTSQIPKEIRQKNVEPTKENSKSNPFEVLTLVENDVELGTNGETLNLANQEANSSGSSFWNVDSSSPSTTPIVEKIDKIKKLITDGKVTLVDDEGKPLRRVVFLSDYDSEDEVASVDNEMASFLAKKDGYGTQSFLEQW